ncbi:MAG: hypothetical protein INQ03_25550 [Candidatus Heimdallarchaeota archaeon]|nr:hypothetical protein [Candidatus Heimdallarchaeota archaeon]
MTEFKMMLDALRHLGQVEESIPTNRNGKASKFVAKLQSNVGNSDIHMGILDYASWKRTIGVDKINQARNYAHDCQLDGAVIIGTNFSQSAINQVERINESESKVIILLDANELKDLSQPTYHL